MHLIIAEKPNLARIIREGIEDNGMDAFTQENGYFEGMEYIISYAFGHLFGLYNIDEYLGREKGIWSLSELPFYPEHFKFGIKKTKGKPDEGIKKQFAILCDLLNRQDVDSVIHAGDADREGEVIVRLILKNGLKSQKPVKRLWLQAMAPAAIKKALLEMKDDSEYDNLFREGLGRTYIDWLYGINLTRYLTIKTGELFRVGRVVGAITKIIYDREMEIRNFLPEKYLKPESRAETNGEEIVISLDEKYTVDERAQAEARCQFLNGQKAVVSAIKTERKEQKPGKLFSLDKLQGAAGKKYKFKPSETLEILQGLYEKGYVTYPRTNTEYLPSGERDNVKNVIAALQDYELTFKDEKWIFDDGKVEGHGALMPTEKIPKDLNGRDKQIYELIRNRFLAVFCKEPCLVDKTVMTIRIADMDFKLNGNVLAKPGYLRYEPAEKKDKLLPKLKEGDEIVTAFKPVEKETSPPKRFTIASLNDYCKNPFSREKKESDDEAYKQLFDGVVIGTEATRAGIIENAIQNGYISLTDGTYRLEGLGEYFIHALSALQVDMSKEKSVELSKILKQIYRGELTVSAAVELVKRELDKNFENREIKLPPVPPELSKRTGGQGQLIGRCPKCGRDVKETRAAFSCTGYKEGCSFAIFKNDKYFASLGVTVTAAMARHLLLKKKVKGEFTSSRTGKSFIATVQVDFSDTYPKYTMKFDKKSKK